MAVRAGIPKINYYTYEALGAVELVRKKPYGLQFHEVALCATAAMREDIARAIGIFSGKA